MGRATHLHAGANDDAEWDFEKDYDLLDDFFAPLIGMAVEMVEAGRMCEERPEDHLALKLSKRGTAHITDDEFVILNERLSPLVELYYHDKVAFEAEFTRRRAPGFYDPPKDDSQGVLF